MYRAPNNRIRPPRAQHSRVGRTKTWITIETRETDLPSVCASAPMRLKQTTSVFPIEFLGRSRGRAYRKYRKRKIRICALFWLITELLWRKKRCDSPCSLGCVKGDHFLVV